MLVSKKVYTTDLLIKELCKASNKTREENFIIGVLLMFISTLIRSSKPTYW